MDSKMKASIDVLKNRAESSSLNLVVIGRAGQGKSTLVNSLLYFDTPDSNYKAKEGGKVKSETMVVQMHSKERDGAVVVVWDTPGLYDNGHVWQEKVLAQLSVKTGKRMDLILYCIRYEVGIRVAYDHDAVISLLTKAFGEPFWKHAIFVMTFVNLSRLDKQKHLELVRNVESQLREVLSRALIQQGGSKRIADDVPFLTAGLEPGILQYEKEEWNARLFKKCLERINREFVPTILQVRYGEAIWPLVVRTIGIGVVGAGGGAAVGAALGAGIGALVGVLGGPVGVGTGAWVGAAIGAAVGGAGGGGGASAVAGYIGFQGIKDVRNISILIDKAEKERKTKE